MKPCPWTPADRGYHGLSWVIIFCRLCQRWLSEGVGRAPVEEEQIETLLRLFKETSVAGSDRMGSGQ